MQLLPTGTEAALKRHLHRCSVTLYDQVLVVSDGFTVIQNPSIVYFKRSGKLFTSVVNPVGEACDFPNAFQLAILSETLLSRMHKTSYSCMAVMST